MTLRSEIEKLAKANGWKIYQPVGTNPEGMIHLAAEVKDWCCKPCGGSGYESERYDCRAPFNPAAQMAKRCLCCSGFGHVRGRVEPRWFKYETYRLFATGEFKCIEAADHQRRMNLKPWEIGDELREDMAALSSVSVASR